MSIADDIRIKTYGKEVREAIALGVEQTEAIIADYNNQVINAGNSNAEIVDARGGETTLKTRLGKVDLTIADNINNLGNKENLPTINKTSFENSIKEIYQLILTKLSQSQINDLIGFADINKNKGLIDSTMLAPSLIAMIAGTAGVNVTPASLSVVTDMLANLAVNENKTTFFMKTRNIYDARYNSPGMLNFLNGVVEVNPGWVTSDYMQVIPGANIKCSLNGISVNPGHIAYYDANKQWLQGTNTITIMQAPANCFYIKISNSSGLAIINQVELASTPTTYIDPYILDIKYLHNSIYDSELTERILDGSQTVTKKGCALTGNSAKVNSICKFECSTPKIAYISKKNLIKMTPKTVNGVVVTIEDDGSFTLNGTTTAGTVFGFANYLGYVPMGTTIYRLISYSGYASSIPEVNIGFAGDYIFSSSNLSGMQQATTTKSGALNAAAVYSGSGKTFTNFNMKIIVSLTPSTIFEENSTTSITVPTTLILEDSDFTITSVDSSEITVTYINDARKYTDTEIAMISENIVDIEASLIPPWENKSVLFMGDSITAQGKWVTQFNLVMKPKSFINIAVSSAKWIEDSVIEYDGNPVSSGNIPQNVMGNQVQKVLNNNYEAPDIIIISCGTNDSIETSTIENQFTSAGAYIPLSSVQKNTFAGAMRYSIETLSIKYPLAQIFLCTPIQSAEANRTYATCKQRGDIITSVARRMGLPIINSEECGIYGMFETVSVNGKYLYDGLHPNNAGGILLGNYNARQVANWFIV